jgi:hypothetical protein
VIDGRVCLGASCHQCRCTLVDKKASTFVGTLPVNRNWALSNSVNSKAPHHDSLLFLDGYPCRSIRNSQGLRCRLNTACTLLQEGWNRVNLARPDGKDGQDLFLDYCDGYAAAVGLWKDPAHSGKLVLKPSSCIQRTGTGATVPHILGFGGMRCRFVTPYISALYAQTLQHSF